MKRYPQIDLLRILSALAVIVIHCTSGVGDGISAAANQLSRFAVPMFLVLSGFGHAASRGDEPLRKSYARRLVRVLPEFFIWSIVYLAVDALFGTPHERPLFDLFTGSAYVHLYYVFLLVQFVLLSPLFLAAVKRRRVGSLVVSAAVTLTMQTLFCMDQLGLLVLPDLPLSYARIFIMWPLFYVAGMSLRLSLESSGRRAEPKRFPLPAAAVIWAASAALVVLTPRFLPALASQSMRPDVTLYVFTTLLLVLTATRSVQSTPKPLVFFAGLTFEIYLSHMLVLRLWNEWTVRQDPVIYLSSWQFILLALAGGTAIALAAHGLRVLIRRLAKRIRDKQLFVKEV